MPAKTRTYEFPDDDKIKALFERYAIEPFSFGDGYIRVRADENSAEDLVRDNITLFTLDGTADHSVIAGDFEIFLNPEGVYMPWWLYVNTYGRYPDGLN